MILHEGNGEKVLWVKVVRVTDGSFGMVTKMEQGEGSRWSLGLRELSFGSCRSGGKTPIMVMVTKVGVVTLKSNFHESLMIKGLVRMSGSLVFLVAVVRFNGAFGFLSLVIKELMKASRVKFMVGEDESSRSLESNMGKDDV
ncbi:hypothetical protein V6N13_061299 [Hibiscus sabdariffa]